MITSLQELSQVVTDVVNRIVDVSTQRTSSGNYYTGYDDVKDLISKEDFLKYFDFIANELGSREEVLDLNTTEEHEFDAMYGLAWCPNYQWTQGDEEVFRMSEAEWEESYKFEEISRPASMARKAQLFDSALVNLQPWLKDHPEVNRSAAASLFGISETELSLLEKPAVQQAWAMSRTDPEVAADPTTRHDPSRGIEFVLDVSENLFSRRFYGTFEEAVAAYDAVPVGSQKELFCSTYRNGTNVESNYLLRSNGDGKDFVNDYIITMDARILLASAKAKLHVDPVNKAAWEQLNAAEAKLGVTGIRLGEHDMQVGNWRVHLVPPNGKYGQDDCLTNESGKFLVEFYDLRYRDPKWWPEGQFTGGHYYASTLLGTDGWSHGDASNGLCLDGDIPAWTVTGPQMKVALAFIRENTQPAKQVSLDQKISDADKRQGSGQTATDKKDRGRE